MARYIDADKLEKDFPQSVSKHNVIINGNEYPVFLVDHVLHKIRNYPPADVVEVVRCEDCGMSRETEDERYLFCMQFADTVNYQAFCSYGAPKERGGEK